MTVFGLSTAIDVPLEHDGDTFVDWASVDQFMGHRGWARMRVKPGGEDQVQGGRVAGGNWREFRAPVRHFTVLSTHVDCICRFSGTELVIR